MSMFTPAPNDVDILDPPEAPAINGKEARPDVYGRVKADEASKARHARALERVEAKIAELQAEARDHRHDIDVYDQLIRSSQKTIAWIEKQRSTDQ